MFSKKDDDGNVEKEIIPADWKPEFAKARTIFLEEWELLKQECPDDGDCFDELIETLTAERPCTCKYCGHQEFHHEDGERVGKCKKCRKIKWYFKEFDFFANFRLPRMYLFLLRLLNKGLFFNKNQLAVINTVAYSSSWNLMARIGLALFEALKIADDTQEFDSSLCAEIFTRRSSATPANQKPYTEQQAYEEAQAAETSEATGESFGEQSDSTKASSSDGASDSASTPESTKANDGQTVRENNLEPLQLAIYSVLANGPTSFESLLEELDLSVSTLTSTLIRMELANLIVALAGDRYARQEQSALIRRPNSILTSLQKSFPGVDIVASAINFIAVVYKGISRKYLQLHIADFCRVIAHRAGKDIFSGSAAGIFGFAKETSRSEVLAFNSPLKIIVLV